MSEWKSAKLGDIAEMCLGKMLDKEKNKGELQPYLANVNLRWGGFDLSNLSTMRFEESESERYGLESGDLVVCEGGEPGRCAIWRGEVPQMKIQKAIHRVRTNKNYSNEFVYYRFLLAGRSGELSKHFIGSTIKHLTGYSLKQVEFNYPPLAEQSRIAAVLSALDAKIELNNRINAELEGMAKLLYDYWFVQHDFPISAAQAAALGKPHLTGKPYRSSGCPMVFDPQLKREIPVGWEVKELADIANVTMGQSPPGNTYNEEGKGYLFFQGSTDFGWRFPTPRQFTTAPTRHAHKGSILLSVRAPVGTLNIAPEDCAIGRGLAALSSKTSHESFLLQVLQNLQSVFARRNGDGTTFGSINRDDLRTLKVTMPPDDELLKAYESAIGSTHQMIFNNHQQNQELAQLRDWLLPMLMNGQVRVDTTTT
ncbi:MAG: restriction endonuclease subunit S [Akkermansiaceae bacterium]|jgi:type I restriction enzyme S subunit|nr:restriction endonuclease subunit S [Luteolibacter sp.]